MAKKEAESAGLGFGPEDFEAGGFLDDVDGLIKTMRAEMWDYNGERPEESPALHVVIETEDGDERDEYFSAGSADKVGVSKDGLRFVAAGDSTSKGLKKTSKAALFIGSLYKAGFDVDKVTAELDCFDDTRVHFKQTPYTGYGSKPDGTSTILLVSKVYGDDDKKKGSSGGKAPAAGKGKTSAIAEKADATILELLGDNNNKIAKSKLSTLVFKALKKDADVKAVTELALDEEYLGADDRPFDYDGDTLMVKE